MHEHDLELPERTTRVLVGVAVALALFTVVGLVVLWPDGSGTEAFDDVGYVNEFHGAEVVTIEQIECPGGDIPSTEGELTCVEYEFELRSGPDEGETVTQEIYDTSAGFDFDVGDEVVMAYDPDVGVEFRYSVADRERRSVLVALAVLFALAVILLGRMRGLAALGGLAATVILLLLFTLPAIIDGRNPLAVALVSAAAIAFVAIYLAHGVNLLTTVALLGTLGSLALTAVLAVVFTGLADITGFAEEEAGFLAVGGAQLDFRGLILAGIVIGALGAIDDMTVTQASAVAEINRANPEYGLRRIYLAATRIGRDHVASTVNTLVLAYAGASMPLLLLFVVTDQPLGIVANGELVATEIVRTLVGSIGLVAAVPLTTWLAGVAVKGRLGWPGLLTSRGRGATGRSARPEEPPD